MMKKLQNNLYLIFLILFIPCLLLISAFFVGRLTSTANIIYFAGLGALFTAFFFCTNKAVDRLGSKFFYGAVAVISLAFLAFQLFHCLTSFEIPLKGDNEALYTGIKEAVSFGELTDSTNYFLRYPHQMLTLLFYTVINRIFVILGSPDAVNMLGSITLNCLMTTAGGILLTFAVKKVTDEKFALNALFVFAMCNSYWGSSAILYCHALSVIFVCFVIFAFTFFSKAESKPAKIIWAAVCGVSLSVCQNLEGITAIAIVAAVIFICISTPSIKTIAVHCGVIIIMFAVTSAAISGVYNLLGIIDYTDKYKEELPKTHWFVLGLSETGTYQEDDYQDSVNTPGYDEKVAMHKEKIAERISSRTAGELLDLMLVKQERNWLGKTYGQTVEAVDNNAYNYAYRFIMILSVLAGAVYALIKRFKAKSFDINITDFCRIYIIGIFLFFFIWESYTTYLFSSFPFLLFCGITGLYDMFKDKLR